MLLPHWTETRAVTLGEIADRCLRCDAVRSFVVQEEFAIPYVFFIPMSRGTLTQTIRSCRQCGLIEPCHRTWYHTIVPSDEAARIPLQRLLEQSNPEVAQRIEDEARWRDAASNGNEDSALWLALSRLKHCVDADGLAASHEARLTKWVDLSSEARQALSCELELYVRAQETKQRVIWLMRGFAQQAPQAAGLLPALLLGVLLLVAAFAVLHYAAASVAPDARTAVALAAVAAVLLLGYLGYRAFQALAFRGYFAEHLLRPVGSMGLDMAEVLRTFDSLKRTGTGQQARGLLKHRWVLIRLLRSRGQLPKYFR